VTVQGVYSKIEWGELFKFTLAILLVIGAGVLGYVSGGNLARLGLQSNVVSDDFAPAAMHVEAALTKLEQGDPNAVADMKNALERVRHAQKWFVANSRTRPLD